MCIKVGDSELDTVKALMNMSLNSIISDIFDLDLDEIKPELSLKDDLSITSAQAKELTDTIAEYFDDLSINLSEIATLSDLFEIVVFAEFDNALHEH